MAEGVVTSVAGKVVDSMFVVAKKEIGYMWNCKYNVEEFRSEVQKLNDMKGRIQQKIELAKNKGDNLVHGVEGWVNDVNAEISKAEEFITEEANAKKTCFGIGLCGNWSTLHHYGKKATQTTSLMKLQELGKPYESFVSVDTPIPGQIDCYQTKNLDGIITQNSALGDIITAIEDESVQIIGIYGVGGVGKTTLAKEVAARVKNLFAAVAFTTISQTLDADKIKKDTENETKRIMKGEKVLIILDDVWEKLDLEELSIPFGKKRMNCKILLTSRNEDVCDRMNAQSKICVNSLPLKEAWILFKHVVGDKVETDINLKSIAMEVAKECSGLPLIIDVIGNTLKNRDVNSWKAALTQIRKNAPANIDPSIKKAFTRLKLSYDYLENEEVQWCFLQCSMYPEDSQIWLEELVHYGVGLEKFKELENMEDARSSVQNAVNILKSSSLLLDAKNGGQYAKMHDVVRDVALLIASKGKTNFLVMAKKGLTKWLPRNNISQSYTGISLMCNRISELPEYQISFPRLEAAYLQQNDLSSISDEFIKGMKNARVLVLEHNCISFLPQSLMGLSEPRMLNLSRNEFLCDISILGELKGLEILFLNKTGIKEVPACIGELVNLRRLEVTYCFELSYTTPGVIKKLERLEELRIHFGIHSNGIHECLAEVMCLSMLTYLDIKVPRLHDIPEGFNFDKLKGFGIQIGEEYSTNPMFINSTERYLTFFGITLEFPFLKWMKKLIEVSRPYASLYKIQNLNNLVPDLYQEGFNKLEYIKMWECHNVTCLVDICDRKGNTNEKFLMELKHLHLRSLDNLKFLWNRPDDEFISLTNLVNLYISGCHKLVRLFPMSVAQGLVSLKEIGIEDCMGLEEMIWGQTEMAANIVFPYLTSIKLFKLFKLKSFYSGSCGIKYPSLMEVTVRYCYEMEIWGPGIHETPKLKFVNHVPLDGPYSVNDAVVKSVYESRKAKLQISKMPLFSHTRFPTTSSFETGSSRTKQHSRPNIRISELKM
ncbi:probable disease resistance protein At4g27220 [Rutidosis leptorrhynchoides]|uniref:probable disease resistance protein At4g27220 n=1 Tax=Rutidosis leptorrhynchoides TaxID=125765 RepID=UPI003A9942BB